MQDLGQLGPTTPLDLTTSAGEFTGASPYRTVVVVANRNCHLAVGATADFNAFLLVENTYARLTLEPDSVLSFVLADGEVDGVIRVTGVG